MPAKIDTELNLRFLYICFKHSNFSTVDFHEVASYFQIKAPAARMRLMRLRQALEAESSREGFKERDRKRRLNPFKAKEKTYALHDGEDDDDESLDDMPLMQRLHARMMRIKREEGLMIKDEDGTLVKGEDDAMIKNEDDGFWGKKEEDLDEQDDKRLVKKEGLGSPFLKSEIDPIDMEDVVKSETHGLTYAPSPVQQNARAPYPSLGHAEITPKPEHMHSLAIQHPAPYSGLVKMEIDTKRNDYGYGNQHSQAALANPSHFNFRVYEQPNNLDPFAQTQSNLSKPEDTNNAAPFLGYNSLPHPDTYNPFTHIKPETPHGSAHITPPSEHNSPFRLDMFNTALPNSQTPVGEQVRSRLSFVDSVTSSPRIKDDVSETASEQGYPSPAVHQSRQDQFR
ncbi:hypothetical protein D6D19_01103 [Aureobasidium pullulans]|uniref:Myb-like DNA-binding domain-containing protein n=1 Tax=Aureobasidium pullulans TaxID=5580 RepID=A0A4S9LI97_AURPU|nr:hypothetical protein D6D29_00250 [Aureobasidium pullulans]THW79528.1 hypothetical protein D6D19_01103 [Aureobasidium pullulans]THY29247.1 hypothetical protein D6D00_03682 [Aureobasidium pullulans]